LTVGEQANRFILVYEALHNGTQKIGCTGIFEEDQ